MIEGPVEPMVKEFTPYNPDPHDTRLILNRYHLVGLVSLIVALVLIVASMVSAAWLIVVSLIVIGCGTIMVLLWDGLRTNTSTSSRQKQL